MAAPPKKSAKAANADLPEALAAELDDLRQQIDGIDQEILECLNRRARSVQRVGEIKEGGRRSPIYVASRERDLVRALVESNPGVCVAPAAAPTIQRW